MRYDLGRFRRPMRRSAEGQLMSLISLGDGSTLSLDFTSMSGLDSRFTFSRASTATFINSSGLVQYADANLILQSESLATSPWIPTNGASVADVSTTNPIGGSTATQLTSGGASNSVLQGPSLAANVPHTVRFWVRGGTSTQMQFGYFSGSFQTASGITVVGSGSVTGTGLMTITGLSTTTWTQVTFVLASPAASGSLLFYPDTASPTVGRTNFVWGVQMNAGSTASAYNRTTTSAYHAPRFDYDPTTLAPRGLLIEGSATNLLMYSGDWTQSGAGFWSARTNMNTGGTWTGFTAPDNSASAIKLIPNTVNGRHSIENNSTQMNGSTVYTVSMFFKADGYSVAGIVVAGGQTRRNFILSGAGSLGSGFGITNTATITPYANGWYRCSVTWTTNGSGSLGAIGVWAAIPQNATTDPVAGWVGDNTSGIQCWGAQVETSSGASSYIPTGSSTVQRAADECVITGTSFSSWFNSTAGTFLAHALRSRTSDVGRIASANDTTANESIDIGASTTGQFIVTDGGSALATITPGTVTANTAFKIAGAFALNNVQAALGGTLGTADTSVTLPTVTQLHIGRQGGASPVYLNGTVSLLKFWPTRLPDATLQSLTQ